MAAEAGAELLNEFSTNHSKIRLTYAHSSDRATMTVHITQTWKTRYPLRPDTLD